MTRYNAEFDELIRYDESRTDEKLRQLIAAADAEADRNDGDEESLEDHNIQGRGELRAPRERDAKVGASAGRGIERLGMSKHTPGPWEVSVHNAGLDGTGKMHIQRVISAPTGIIVYEVGGVNAEADAQLIAASPSLAEALQDCMKWLSAFAFSCADREDLQTSDRYKKYVGALKKAGIE